MGLADVLGQDAEVEQAHVGVRAARKPRNEHGKQVALDRGASAGPLREGCDVREGARRVAVADGGQSVARALGVQGNLVFTQGCGGRDDRPVEHVLVQGAHAGAHLVEGRANRVSVGKPRRVHGPSQNPQVAILIGNQVIAAHARQLRAMLHGAQESVARGELVRVGSGDIAALAQRLDRLQGRAHPQERVGAPVNQLEELHGELDVAQAAAAELKLTRGVGAGNVVFDAPAHRARRLHEALARRGGPHVGLGGFLEGAAEL